MEVTGPNTDIWLVRTLAVILLAIGLCLLAGPFKRDMTIPVLLLGLTSAAGLAVVDFYFWSNNTIRWVYVVDGIIQCLFVAGWVTVLYLRKRYLAN